jgi:Fe-S cluster assembly protein SufD
MNAPAAAVRDSLLDRILRDYRGLAAATVDSALPADAALRADAALPAAQSRAAARLGELGWPSARDEQWRYTNLRAFERVSDFRPASAAASGVAPGAQDLLEGPLPPAIPGFERLICLDGVLRSGAARAQRDTGAVTTPPWSAEQRLGLLGDMFATDAVQLRVHGEAAYEVLFITSEHARGGAVYPRLDLHVEPGGRLQLIERHLGAPGAPTLVACNVTVELERDAVLTHYRLQQCGRETVFADTLSARLSEQARYLVRSVAVGGAAARTSAGVELRGRGAALTWAAIAVGRGEQVHDVALKVQHCAPETATEELFRGIADERARVAFSGHIHIDATAPGSQARQSLRGLIEGAQAEIDLRPRLEILTDEVRAQHGATTGRLDEDLLFYLLARGIDRTTARALLKWAFLGDVLREIELPGVRGEAEQLAAGQLPDVNGAFMNGASA